jgi:hypothetical protein
MTCACFHLFDSVQFGSPRANAENQRLQLNTQPLTNTGDRSVAFVQLLLAHANRLSSAQLELLPIAVAIRSALHAIWYVTS